MKRIFLWGWTEPDMLKAIELLKENSKIKIIDWVGDSDELEKSYVKFLYNQPYFGKFLIEKKWELTSEEILKFLDMFSREKRSQGLPFHEQQNIAKNYFRYFIWLLNRQKIDHLIFSMIPLIGFDYLCYLSARRLGLSITMCYQSIFPNRFFYCKDLNDFGRFRDVKSLPFTDAPAIDWGYKKDLFYMKGTVRKNRAVNPWKLFIKNSIRYGLRKSTKPMNFAGVVQNFIQTKEFQSNYQNAAQEAYQLPRKVKFVYFPLHLQPELTTSGLGGAYSDQLEAIERVAEMLPDNWYVFVKENPKQGHEQRGKAFYQRLKSIDKVVYVAKEVDTYELLNDCQFVATITGTAGWESITGGKPCLVFGLAWYKNMPGVFEYREDRSIDQLLAYEFNKNKLTNSFSELFSKMRTGIVDAVYNKIYHHYDSAENSKNISIFLKEVILEE